MSFVGTNAMRSESPSETPGARAALELALGDDEEHAGRARSASGGANIGGTRLGQPFTLRTQASTSAGSPPAATTAAIGTAVMFGGIGIAISAGGGIDASSARISSPSISPASSRAPRAARRRRWPRG